jgi:glycosyltransferase involved in cell wall biosynthesis
MKQKHIVYVVSHVHKSLSFEWIASGLMDNYKLSFILLNSSPSALEDFLTQQRINVKRISCRTKRDLIFAFLRTFFYFLFKRPQIIHAHLFDAQIIGLTAAWMTGVKKRVYTRHNSNYHHAYHPKGVKYDRWSNRIATHIVSISQATDKTLIEHEGVPISKIIKIPHGFDLGYFIHLPDEKIISFKMKWGIPNKRPVIGVIARHIEWKGIQYIISAFNKFRKENPTAFLILANASGPFHQSLVEMLKGIPKDSVKLIPFEEDVALLYSVFDIYVHAPIDPICEAFGQTYIEALAAGIPSIFTLSGIAAEFIVDEQNALVVKFKSDESIYLALMRLWGDDDLKKRLVIKGRQDVISRFRIERMLVLLKELYEG